MGLLRKMVGGIVRAASKLYFNNSLAQESMSASGESLVKVDAASIIRQAAAEGIVLLKNEGVLPLGPDRKVAIFGRTQLDWFYMGYGSGGDVNAPYRINLIQAATGRIDFHQGLAARYQKWCSSYVGSADEGFWGQWPISNPEMPISDKDVESLSSACDTAIVCFGRATGEDRDNKLQKGGYYLTKAEETLLERVSRHFDKTIVVLDIGSTIDMQWVKHYSVDALLVAYFGGQESCNALVDVLTGEVCPSGKLPDTIAREYRDYPSSAHFGERDFNDYVEDIYVGYRYFETFCPYKAIFPFGFGLSYTTFAIECKEADFVDGVFTCQVEVTNTGKCAGKEVVQLYVQAPQGLLGKSVRSLVAFAKTDLLQSGESQRLTLSCTEYDFASYDDTGFTGFANCYVLEKGRYDFFVGNSVKAQQIAYTLELDDTKEICRLQEIMSLSQPFDRLVPQLENGGFVEAKQPIPAPRCDLKKRILAQLPMPAQSDKQNVVWQDVVDGKATLDDFVAQLSLDELEALTRGQGFMNSPLGPAGNGGAIGGIIPELQQRGVPPVILCDGPSGVRLRAWCNLYPSCVAMAASWNPALVRQAGELLGKESAQMGIHVLLAPGMNIHRNPLCGRNFEYTSEDPVLSGYIAAAYVEGVQSTGVGACIKHLSCNHQERNRNRNDSRVSQRALREIYLKGFEIAVKRAAPYTIMTSYNKINGVWSHYNFDLATTVVRQEWGYDGLVMTDWWMQHDVSHEFAAVRDNAYRVRAQVDVYMPGSYSRIERVYRQDPSLLETIGQEEGITRAEIERSAKRTLQLALRVIK